MKDACQYCLGAKGNVRGNENIIGGVICCDDCSVLVQRAVDAETSKLKALLPDEREREALRYMRASIFQDTTEGHFFDYVTYVIGANKEDAERGLAVIDRLLAASHSEGTP